MIYLFSRFIDIMSSCRELDSWTQDFVLPPVVWLSGLFNPQSFLIGEVTVSKSTINDSDNVCSRKINIYLFIHLFSLQLFCRALLARIRSPWTR